MRLRMIFTARIPSRCKTAEAPSVVIPMNRMASEKKTNAGIDRIIHSRIVPRCDSTECNPVGQARRSLRHFGLLIVPIACQHQSLFQTCPQRGKVNAESTEESALKIRPSSIRSLPVFFDASRKRHGVLPVRVAPCTTRAKAM